MPLQIVYSSGQNGFEAKTIPFSTSPALWMENDYVDGFNKARSGEIPLFKSVVFQKEHLQGLADLPDCHWVTFSPVILTKGQDKVCSLWSVAADEAAVPLLGDDDKIIIATEISNDLGASFPVYSQPINKVNLLGISEPKDKSPDQFQWIIPEFEDESLANIVAMLEGGTGEDINPFLSIHLLKDDLKDIAAQAGCTQIAFMPIVLQCRVKEDLISDRARGVFEVSLQTTVTLLVVALDADNNVLARDIDGVEVLNFGADSWPPDYRPWE